MLKELKLLLYYLFDDLNPNFYYLIAFKIYEDNYIPIMGMVILYGEQYSSTLSDIYKKILIENPEKTKLYKESIFDFQYHIGISCLPVAMKFPDLIPEDFSIWFFIKASNIIKEQVEGANPKKVITEPKKNINLNLNFAVNLYQQTDEKDLTHIRNIFWEDIESGLIFEEEIKVVNIENMTNEFKKLLESNTNVHL